MGLKSSAVVKKYKEEYNTYSEPVNVVVIDATSMLFTYVCSEYDQYMKNKNVISTVYQSSKYLINACVRRVESFIKSLTGYIHANTKIYMVLDNSNKYRSFNFNNLNIRENLPFVVYNPIMVMTGDDIKTNTQIKRTNVKFDDEDTIITLRDKAVELSRFVATYTTDITLGAQLELFINANSDKHIKYTLPKHESLEYTTKYKELLSVLGRIQSRAHRFSNMPATSYEIILTLVKQRVNHPINIILADNEADHVVRNIVKDDKAIVVSGDTDWYVYIGDKPNVIMTDNVGREYNKPYDMWCKIFSTNRFTYEHLIRYSAIFGNDYVNPLVTEANIELISSVIFNIKYGWENRQNISMLCSAAALSRVTNVEAIDGLFDPSMIDMLVAICRLYNYKQCIDKAQSHPDKADKYNADAYEQCVQLTQYFKSVTFMYNIDLFSNYKQLDIPLQTMIHDYINEVIKTYGPIMNLDTKSSILCVSSKDLIM